MFVLGLNGIQLLLLMGAAIIIGFSKTGITGATLPAIAMIAYTFGGKLSTGIILTMLITADLPAVYNYGKYSTAKDVIKVLPPAVVGIALGAITGNFLNDEQFKFLMGIIVVICLIILLYKEIAKRTFKVPKNRFFHAIIGVVSGFASMVGNAAGPIFSVYMLSLSFDKNKFIGTTAWFFFIVNLIKVPFHVFLWNTITFDTLKYTGIMIPFILFGALLGVYFVKRINEQQYKTIVTIVTAIAAVRLMV